MAQTATAQPVIRNEGAMILSLREHFASPEYALLPQVRNGTGYERAARTADAIVMGLWPSRGIYLHGIEIKVSRADWMREKQAPEKAEEIARFCDFWWIAAGSDAVVKIEELPVDWGLLVPGKNGKLRVAKAPIQRTDPTPITRLFLASLLRKTTEAAPVFTDVDAAVEKKVAAIVAEKEKQIKSNQDFHTKLRLEDADKLRARIEAFERASGIELDRYSEYFNTEIGNAVKALRSAGSDLSIKRKFTETERALTRTLEDLRQQREALEKLWPDHEPKVSK